jgi:hypothetical protein
MDTLTKRVVLATGIIAVAISTHIAANAIYTNTKIGIDKKALLIAGGAGIFATVALLSIFKK